VHLVAQTFQNVSLMALGRMFQDALNTSPEYPNKFPVNVLAFPAIAQMIILEEFVNLIV